MNSKLCFVFLISFSYCLLRSEARPTETGSPLPFQVRLDSTISALEWLLNQLVNILSDMVDCIERESSLLRNNQFRQILIQVIRRIDTILGHFENVDPSILTPNVINELQRIDCIRIRLTNYLSQTNQLDDSRCRPISNNTNSNNNNNGMNNGQIVPLLTQIVTVLSQILQQINRIKQMMPNNPDGGDTTTTTVMPIWTSGTTINWEDLISQFVSSIPDVSYRFVFVIPNNLSLSILPFFRKSCKYALTKHLHY